MLEVHGLTCAKKKENHGTFDGWLAVVISNLIVKLMSSFI
jgi:hypothetical protein